MISATNVQFQNCHFKILSLSAKHCCSKSNQIAKYDFSPELEDSKGLYKRRSLGRRDSKHLRQFATTVLLTSQMLLLKVWSPPSQLVPPNQLVPNSQLDPPVKWSPPLLPNIFYQQFSTEYFPPLFHKNVFVKICPSKTSSTHVPKFKIRYLHSLILGLVNN